MINRLFTRSSLDFSAHQSDRSFRLDGKQYLAYCSKLDAELLELERRTNTDSAMELAIELEPTVAVACADDRCRSQSTKLDPPTYDAAGFEEDFEIDARWI